LGIVDNFQVAGCGELRDNHKAAAYWVGRQSSPLPINSMSQVITPTSSLNNGLVIVDGSYRTPARRVSPLARAFPSTHFYPQLYRNIFRASAIARRGGYGDQAWINTSANILRALEGVGFKFDVTGLDHIARLEGPCLIVGNHMSSLETGVLPALIRPLKPVTFVVKQALLDYPVFKHVMRARKPIAVTQTNPRLDLKTMLSDGVARLAEGTSIIVFPQGARRPTFDPAKFNTIGVKLAQRANVPIIPMALSTYGWPLGKWASDFGRLDPSRTVHFAFGEPMWVEGKGAAANAALIDFIQTHLRQWGVQNA
jgi:1-acyl-sn-glycerol-3-phosphate acyltransferase